MEYGSEEWFEKVNEHYQFPCKIAFIMIKENDDSTSICTTVIKSKSQLENVKYSHISKDTWTSKGSAVLSVKEIQSAKGYFDESERLKDVWGFALTKK